MTKLIRNLLVSLIANNGFCAGSLCGNCPVNDLLIAGQACTPDQAFDIAEYLLTIDDKAVGRGKKSDEVEEGPAGRCESIW